MTTILVLVALAEALLAVTLVRKVSNLRQTAERMRGGLIDEPTGLLAGPALPLRFQPELDWARLRKVEAATVVIRVYGGATDVAGAALARVSRDFEPSFRIRDNEFVVLVLDIDPVTALLAAARLAASAAPPGEVSGDAGVALFPADGESSSELMTAARARLRPIEQVIEEAASFWE